MQTKLEIVGLKALLTKFGVWDTWQEKYDLKDMALFSGRQKRVTVSLDSILMIVSLNTVLNSILITDNWDQNKVIDVESLTVGDGYVRKCIEDIAELRNTNDYETYKLFIYYAIATRFYIEKINKNLPVPSTRLSLEKSIDDFNKLKNADPQSLNLGSDIGRKASNYFMEELRFSCKKTGKNLTHSEYWYSSSLIGRIVSFMKKENCILPRCFARHRNDLTPSQFRPAAIKYLTHYVTQKDPRVSVKRFFNPCGGWGDKLLGGLATDGIERIVQTDPNESLMPAMWSIYDTYDPAHEKVVYLFNKPMEDLTIQELCPNGQKNGFTAFSPPFFNKELYPGENQSHKRYPTIDRWVTGFLYESVKVCYRALDVHGIFAINLADIQMPNQTLYKLTDCLVHFLENDMSPYFRKFCEPIIYPTINTPNESKIFIYQAKEYKDALPKLLQFSMDPWTVEKNKNVKKPINKKTNHLPVENNALPCAEPVLPVTKYYGNPVPAPMVLNPHLNNSHLQAFSLFRPNPAPAAPQFVFEPEPLESVYNLTLAQLHGIILQEARPIDVANRLGIDYYQLMDLFNQIGWDYSILKRIDSNFAEQNLGDSYHKPLSLSRIPEPLQIPFYTPPLPIEVLPNPNRFLFDNKRKKEELEEDKDRDCKRSKS